MTMATLEQLFQVQEEVTEDKVDWLNDRIQPYVLFQMPDGGWVEFPLGIFIPSTPTKKDSFGRIVREVEAYDGLVVLDQDKFTSRTAYTAGTAYESVVNDILRGAGITKIKITFPVGKTLATTKEFEIGTSKLQAVNDLLTEINFVPLWVDVNGYYVSYPYETPDNKRVDYLYTDRELSIIFEGAEEELDLFEVPNSWVVTVSNPEAEPIVSTKVNDSPDSPTSTVSRGRTIVDAREVDDMADQASLDAYVERIAFEASQVYGSIKFRTPLMPFHENYDVLGLQYAPLGIDGKYAEMNWNMKLEAGGQMEHVVRKVVSI
ncbi:hypothetical protein HV436_01375 [Bacillus sporothermodurans]|nr:hypothetical protein [Heyndrickxia sporothermodurans]MBL5798514.1 hypothetical protein [Heyndrickxia sporothermodurans]MBL5809431.1 hypothetical protein [Heyndrickxia sporothermodurans]MBL5813066.1 hypothetical protein [Heyndrickxia sporothermodurans]MBL5816490.1 hypothetical protein [Heyndrickxia sporothermodurans]